MLSKERLWTTALIEQGRSIVDLPLLASIITLGWIPIVTTSYIFIANGVTDQRFIIVQSLTASIIVLGPYQAYKYDTEVLPNFFIDVKELVNESDASTLHNIQTEALRRFRKKYIPFVSIWILAVVSVLPLNNAYFASYGITSGSVSYIVYIIFLIDFGFFAGLGTFSVIVTILSIKSISQLSLQVEPLHPDGLGGLSVFGDFSISSTLLISNGALAIPLALEMITTAAGALVVYSGTGLYILFIIISFVYPTLKVNRTAQRLREEHLDKYRARIRSLENEISAVEAESESTLKEISLRMEIERVRREFQNYKNVRLYPLSIGIFIRLASSILLPIGFTLLDFFLPRLL